MIESLNRIKEELRSRYLGKHGIHGVGIRESENLVCIYLDPNSDLERSQVWEAIRKAAAPYQIVLIPEERPRAL